ncbi:MAG TPA: DMT family transporter [Vicinamibacterales bacterium]|nr:DMT family transporter [Vicinamibacterales bacterium]
MLDFLLLLMVVIWGSNFSVIKLALREFPEVTFNALRLLLASVVFLVAIAVVRARARAGLRPPEPPLTLTEWRLVFLLGLLGTVLYQLLFLAGIARTSVANSALIFGCTPVAVAIIASVTGYDRLSGARWAGAALSLAGIYVLVGRRAELSGSTLAGDALIFGSMLCWSLYSVLAQPLLKRHSPLVITGLAMASGTIVYWLFAIAPMLETNWGAISRTSWVLMASSSLLALAFAYMVWYTAVQRIGSSRTAIYSNLTPIVAMIVAAVWLGEQITRPQILGAVLILSGIAITRLVPARA